MRSGALVLPGTLNLRTWRLLAGVCLIVSALLVSSPAQAAGEYVQPVPASGFSVSNGAGRSIGSAVVLWGTGAAVSFVQTTEPTYRLEFTAEAEQCQGLPRIEVAVDDRTYVAHQVAGYGTYAAVGNWSPGRHKVTLRYRNDFLGSNCDRNVKFRSVRFPEQIVDGNIVPTSTIQWGNPLYASINPSTAGTIDSLGSSWWLGPTARLWSPGTMAFDLDSQGARQLFVALDPTACEGLPSLRITVDGAVVRDGTVPIPINGAPSYIWVVKTWPDGVHKVELTMHNDLRTALCDRSLRLFELAFSGSV